VTDRLRPVPFAAEVDAFEAEIGCYQQFVSGGWPKHGAIVTNSCDQRPTGARGDLCETADALNQLSFRAWHVANYTVAEFNVRKAMASNGPLGQ